MAEFLNFDGFREIVLGVVASFFTAALVAVASWIAVRTGFGKAHRNAQRHLRQGRVLQTAGDFTRAREEFETSISLLRRMPNTQVLCADRPANSPACDHAAVSASCTASSAVSASRS